MSVRASFVPSKGRGNCYQILSIYHLCPGWKHIEIFSHTEWQSPVPETYSSPHRESHAAFFSIDHCSNTTGNRVWTFHVWGLSADPLGASCDKYFFQYLYYTSVMWQRAEEPVLWLFFGTSFWNNNLPAALFPGILFDKPGFGGYILSHICCWSNLKFGTYIDSRYLSNNAYLAVNFLSFFNWLYFFNRDTLGCFFYFVYLIALHPGKNDTWHKKGWYSGFTLWHAAYFCRSSQWFRTFFLRDTDVSFNFICIS